jgi:hypothetical protein
MSLTPIERLTKEIERQGYDRVNIQVPSGSQRKLEIPRWEATARNTALGTVVLITSRIPVRDYLGKSVYLRLYTDSTFHYLALPVEREDK